MIKCTQSSIQFKNVMNLHKSGIEVGCYEWFYSLFIFNECNNTSDINEPGFRKVSRLNLGI